MQQVLRIGDEVQFRKCLTSLSGADLRESLKHHPDARMKIAGYLCYDRQNELPPEHVYSEKSPVIVPSDTIRYKITVIIRVSCRTGVTYNVEGKYDGPYLYKIDVRDVEPAIFRDDVDNWV